MEYSSYEVLLHPEHGFGFATIQTAFGVDLVPAVLNLAAAEVGLASAIARELRLRNALMKGQAEQYDFIFIDTPPSLGLFTLNALTAADVVLVPLQLQVYAYEALGNLEATIELVRQLDPNLQIGGIICTMADRRTNLTRVIESQAAPRMVIWSSNDHPAQHQTSGRTLRRGTDQCVCAEQPRCPCLCRTCSRNRGALCLLIRRTIWPHEWRIFPVVPAFVSPPTSLPEHRDQPGSRPYGRTAGQQFSRSAGTHKC